MLFNIIYSLMTLGITNSLCLSTTASSNCFAWARAFSSSSVRNAFTWPSTSAILLYDRSTTSDTLISFLCICFSISLIVYPKYDMFILLTPLQTVLYNDHFVCLQHFSILLLVYLI